MAFCFCFLVGVAVISIIDKKIPFVWLYFLFFVLIAFLIIFWKNKQIVFMFFCLLVFLLGFARYELAFPLFKDNITNHYNERIVAEGYITEEPDVREDGTRYIVKLLHVTGYMFHDNVYVKQGLYPRYNYGDKLQLDCLITKPEELDNGFRYDRYLARYGVFAICGKAELKKIGEDEGNILMRELLRIKNVVASKINLLWHEPYAGFMGGLLYGYRGGLGELNDLFAKTGITHIIAISGYNITIIASILFSLCLSLYIPRKKAFWLIVSGIILFVIFTGASGSVVRAGIMGILVLVARQAGRLSKIGYILMFTAVAMVLINPFILIWDVGFQLSFISTLGLVYLQPLISNRVERGERSLSDTLKNVNGNTLFKRIQKRFLTVCGRFGITECLSAIIATLPLILFQFGRLSIVALPVNILVLWIIPFLMLGGFVAVILSSIFFPLGQIVAWITWVGMKYIVVVVEWFGSLKFSAINIVIPWWIMVTMYIFMIYFIIEKQKK